MLGSGGIENSSGGPILPLTNFDTTTDSLIRDDSSIVQLEAWIPTLFSSLNLSSISLTLAGQSEPKKDDDIEHDSGGIESSRQPTERKLEASNQTRLALPREPPRAHRSSANSPRTKTVEFAGRRPTGESVGTSISTDSKLTSKTAMTVSTLPKPVVKPKPKPKKPKRPRKRNKWTSLTTIRLIIGLAIMATGSVIALLLIFK